MSSVETIGAVKSALSAPRMSTYESAANVRSPEDLGALLLYAWNAEVSGALLAPLHICEVVIRNAVADAVEAIYGPKWPWSPTFERSLPDPLQGYSPRRDLQSARRTARTTGKVIPELSFVFWQKMFTGRYDTRIWIPHLCRTLPNLEADQTVAQSRKRIYADLERVRLLRNRIAHHEPIFSRVLEDDYQVILRLVTYRCKLTADWLHSNQKATEAIEAKPTQD